MLSSITEKNFTVMVTPIWPLSADAKPLTPEFLRAMVAAAAQKSRRRRSRRSFRCAI